VGAERLENPLSFCAITVLSAGMGLTVLILAAAEALSKWTVRPNTKMKPTLFTVCAIMSPRRALICRVTGWEAVRRILTVDTTRLKHERQPLLAGVARSQPSSMAGPDPTNCGPQVLTAAITVERSLAVW
jgi:hypothetical protein